METLTCAVSLYPYSWLGSAFVQRAYKLACFKVLLAAFFQNRRAAQVLSGRALERTHLQQEMRSRAVRQILLSYSAVSFTADVDEYVRLGNLEYYNGRTDTGTAVDSVPLDLQVSFAQPFSDSFSLDYGFDFYVTPNTTGDNTRDADSLFLLPQLNQTTFDYNYSQYSLELVGFSDNDGSTISNVFLCQKIQPSILACTAA